MEEALQEIEVIKSIYSENEEIVIEEQSQNQIVFSIKLHSQKISSDVILTLTLQSNYPDSVPSISVKGPHVSRGQGDMIKSYLEKKCGPLKGDPMLFQLISFAYDFIEESFCKQDAETNLDKISSITHTTVLRLDHMRHKIQYCKIIERWTRDLNLVGRLMFCQGYILILLQGDKEDIKKYICNNRTQLVDVDSRGRPCKERLLSVLIADDTSYDEVYTDFDTWEVGSLQALQDKFDEVGLKNLFKELNFKL